MTGEERELLILLLRLPIFIIVGIGMISMFIAISFFMWPFGLIFSITMVALGMALVSEEL